MNNLPLQPLVWIEANHPNGVYFEKTDSYIRDAICFCSTLATYYVIRRGNDTGMYVVTYGGRTENEYHTLEEAKEWCEFTHYPSKMQPYVKPMPTWISVKDKLPTHHQDVIVYRYDDDEGGSIEHSLYLDGEVMKGFGNVSDEEGFFDDVYYWQPIETEALYEAMAMQLQIKGE